MTLKEPPVKEHNGITYFDIADGVTSLYRLIKGRVLKSAQTSRGGLLFGLVLLVLDCLWSIFGFLIASVVIGGLFTNILVSIITTGTLGFGDPRTWPIVQLIASNSREWAVVG